MSIFGSPAPVSAQSALAGAAQAERAIVKEVDRKRPSRPAAAKRTADGVDLEVSDVDTADAVRNLKGNDQEEAHEDRREHEGYSPAPGDETPHIDVEG